MAVLGAENGEDVQRFVVRRIVGERRLEERESARPLVQLFQRYLRLREAASGAFRRWAKAEGLLLVPPEDEASSR